MPGFVPSTQPPSWAVHFYGTGQPLLCGWETRSVGLRGSEYSPRAGHRLTQRAPPTRLETRTKESDMDASTRVTSLCAQ